jgi:ABC-2 type transport system ATP-binding protein
MTATAQDITARSPTGNAIECRELSKRFGDFVAVDGVSFEVRPGEVFGFLGPNGAGKTTTMRMLATLLAPSGGRATINGFDISREQQKVRQSIGMIFQDPSLDDRLTGLENLKFHAMLYDVPQRTFDTRARELLEMVDLGDKVDQRVQTYSGGMRRRLEIARGLLHHPAVLFLDEPTIGLDPQTRRHIWNYLLRLRDQEGVTMFMTTHYMDEAEHCDRIAIIDHGKIVALDTPEALKALVGGDIVTIRTTDNAGAETRLASMPGIETRSGPDGQLIVETAHGDRFIPEMIARLGEGPDRIEVSAVSLSHPTLEDVFVKLTGHTIRQQGADPMDRMRMGARMWGGGRRR